MSIHRRSLLTGLASAPLLAGRASAASNETAIELSDRLDQLFERVRRDTMESLSHAPSTTDLETRTIIAEGIAGYALSGRLRELSPEEERTPAAQDALFRAARAVGRAMVRTGALIDAHLAETRCDPGGEELMRVSLEGTRGVVDAWQTDHPTRGGALRGLDQVLAMETPGQLRHRMRQDRKRLGRLQRVAERRASRWRTGPRPAALDRAASQLSSSSFGEVVIGLLGLGMVVLGAWISIVGIACIFECGFGGVLLLAFGVALAVAGLRLVELVNDSRAPRDEGPLGTRRRSYTSTSDPLARVRPVHPGPFVPAGKPSAVRVGTGGWRMAGLRRTHRRPIHVTATGTLKVHHRIIGPEGTDSDDGLELLRADLPAVVLLGRVGDEYFVIGEEGTIPAGPEGELELAVNVADVRSEGRWTVELQQLRPER